jgi:hypothetical protein
MRIATDALREAMIRLDRLTPLSVKQDVPLVVIAPPQYPPRSAEEDYAWTLLVRPGPSKTC